MPGASSFAHEDQAGRLERRSGFDLGLNWGKDARPSKADLPRKPRGSERPGHAHEQLVLTVTLIFIAAAGVLGFASWSVNDADISSADIQALKDAGVLIFGTAGAMLVSLGLWLFLDLRTPMLLISGGATVAMLVLGFSAPVFWLVAPTAMVAFWAGLSALDRHPVDRWTAVALAVVLALVLGSTGLLLFAPVALFVALVPMLEFGDPEESSADD
jgi:hypothetical protein